MRLTDLRIEKEMPIADFANLYRAPVGKPEEYRKQPLLTRLLRNRVRDEEGETRRQNTHAALGMKSRRAPFANLWGVFLV